MQQVHAQQQQQVQTQVVAIIVAAISAINRKPFSCKTFLQAHGIISTSLRLSNCRFPK
jgi:hypothetical protein